MRSVTCIAYSSSANLGPGYDVLAIAHSAYYDKVSLTELKGTENGKIRIIGNDVPEIPEHNTAGLSLIKLFEDKGIKESIEIKIKKGVPHGLGVGSSGASASAAVCAANELFNLDLTMDEMVYYAMQGEVASSGTPHADNVGASLYGGMIIVQSLNPLRIKKIKITDHFNFLMIIPHSYIQGKTRKAREMVPKRIETTKYVENSRYLSSLISGFVYEDRDLIREGMNDSIIEVSRQSLFPFYKEIKEFALKHGAAGACISGAGPTILIVSDGQTEEEKIIEESKNIIHRYGIESSYVRSSIAGGAIIENVNTYY